MFTFLKKVFWCFNEKSPPKVKRKQSTKYDADLGLGSPRLTIDRKNFNYEAPGDGTAEYKKAMDALKKSTQYRTSTQEYQLLREEARDLFWRAAQAGHAEAMAWLGVCLELSIGIPEKIICPQYGLAMKTYNGARKRGSALAHALLTTMWLRVALGLAPNLHQLRSLKKACNVCHRHDGCVPLVELMVLVDCEMPEALFLLGSCLEGGCVIKQDEALAVEMYRKAAIAEYGPACAALARCYHHEGKRDEAKHWYRVGSERGNVTCAVSLARLLEYEDQKEAFALCQNASNSAKGDDRAEAWSALGRCHERGIGTARNLDTAIALYTRSARMGHAPSQYALAMCGDTIHVSLLQAASEAGHIPAMIAVAKLTWDQDEARAVRIFSKAARMGSSRGAWEYGRCLLEGLGGLRKNEYEGVEWIRKAAEAGVPQAQYRMYLILSSGLPTREPAPQEAFQWLKRASLANKYPPAIVEWTELYEQGHLSE